MATNGDKLRSGVWFSFGAYRFDTAGGQLFRNAEPIKLRPKTFDVLLYLLERAGTVVSREELLEAVWPDVRVQPEILTTSIAELRQAFDDSRKTPHYIETLHGRGFRFVAKVRVSKPARERNGSTTFVGRRQEMNTLIAVLDEVFGGAKRIALLSGPAGIGKSRLLQESAALMQARGAQVLRACAEHASQHSAFWIWSQLVHDFAQSSSPAELRARLGYAAADIAIVVPSLQDRLHDIASPPSLDPEMARARFFDGMLSFIKNVAERRPLVLVVDDLQKEGMSSLALLQSVLSDTRLERLLVIAAYRRGEELRNPAFQSLLDAWRTSAVMVEVPVSGLSDEESRELIERTNYLDPTPALTDKIVADSAGNPYFILEILKWLRTHATTAPRSLVGYDIPLTVQRVLQERLKDPSAATRAVLRVGAVIGSEFDVRVAARVVGLDHNELAKVVSEALNAGMLIEPGERVERLRFAHDLIRETLLADLPAVEKADLHYRIGEALEALSVSEADLPQLAYHFSRGVGFGGDQKAIQYCCRAGRQAHERYSNVEAAELLKRALDLAERRDGSADEPLFQILATLAEVYANIDRFADADALVERMFAMGKAYANPIWLARAAIAMSARGYMPARQQHGAAHAAALEKALASLPVDGSLLRGQVAARLAITLFTCTGTEQRRIELAQLAASIAREQTRQIDRGYLLRDAVIAHWDADHLQTRRQLADELRTVALAAGNRYLECEAISWQALDLLARGRLNDLDAFAASTQAMLIETGMPTALLYIKRVVLVSQILRGQLAAAQRTFDEYSGIKGHSAALLNALEPLEPLLMNLALQRENGITADMVAMIRAVADKFPHLPLRQALPYLMIQAGLPDEAAETLAAIAARDFADLPPRNEAHCWLAGVAALGDACAEVGDRKQAAQLYELLQPYSGQWAVIYYAAAMFGSVDRVLARLAANLGRFAEAEALFVTVIDTCAREQAVTELIRAQLDFAAALDAHTPARAAEARDLRRRALGAAQRHDLVALSQRAESLLAGSPPQDAATLH